MLDFKDPRRAGVFFSEPSSPVPVFIHYEHMR